MLAKSPTFPFRPRVMIFYNMTVYSEAPGFSCNPTSSPFTWKTIFSFLTGAIHVFLVYDLSYKSDLKCTLAL